MFNVGDKVILNPHVTEFEYGRGNVPYGEIGEITWINSDSNDLVVRFPSHFSWSGTFNEIVHSSIQENTHSPVFRVGDRVRVNGNVTRPYYQWGSIDHEEIGIITRIIDNVDNPDNTRLVIDFPAHPDWSGIPSEMVNLDINNNNIIKKSYKKNLDGIINLKPVSSIFA